MKTLWMIGILALAGTEAAEADCGCAAWLLTERVAEGKPYVVIEAACAPDAMPKLALQDPAGKAVPLTALTRHVGTGGHAQYMFSPDRALAPGKHTVTFTDRYETTKHALTVVAAGPSVPALSWTSGAKVLGQKQIEFGCGPSKSVEVLASTAASLAFVELVDDKAKRFTGYVPVDKGTLSIGHHMCGGAFDLVRGKPYTATITLLAPERGTTSVSRTVAFTYAP
jgi:hypothetical protein